MKIAFFGFEISPGKYKYQDKDFLKLVEKFAPQKKSPYVFEVIDQLDKAEAVIVDQKKRFDYVFLDLEKLDKRRQRTSQEDELKIIDKLQSLLEEEKFLCDCQLAEEDETYINNMGFITAKPSLTVEEIVNLEDIFPKILEKAGKIIFYTAGKKEVHAWLLDKGSNIVEAAGKIHSDLARGFISADVVNCSLLGEFFNMAEARSKNLVNTVKKDYIVNPGDIIEIKFNV